MQLYYYPFIQLKSIQILLDQCLLIHTDNYSKRKLIIY